MPAAPRIRCRQIAPSDLESAASLLAKGFSSTRADRGFWLRALQRLSEHPSPEGFPKYGYLLESGDIPVGIILLIFSRLTVGGEAKIRCNVSSWYVEPAFRVYASPLVSHALKQDGATYFNISPARDTLPMLEAQGYERYCKGHFAAVPALGGGLFGAHVRPVTPDIRPGADLELPEIDLLLSHARYGCTSVVCTAAGRRYPFVFTSRRSFLGLPYARLLYCRDFEEFMRFAGPLGRFLARRGIPLLLLDANGPIRGLFGRYIERRPKYFKGPDRPRLGDLAYSETALFGV